jgi:putative transposase
LNPRPNCPGLIAPAFRPGLTKTYVELRALALSKLCDMPFSNIFIHTVWATKDRMPFLSKPILHKVIEHIKENAVKKNICIDTMGGHNEHIHCLILLEPTQTVANIMNLIKGESSHWINENHLIKGKFEWQDDYYATSVSPSVVSKVRNYILNQEIHHRKKTFAQEYEEFLMTCGLSEEKG